MSTLKEAFQEAARGIFEAVESCLEDITYKRESAAAYDPDTGTVTANATEVSLRGLAAETNSKDRIADHVDEARQLFYVLAEDLGVEPKVGDIVVVDGMEKRVVDWATDPIKCTWELGLTW